MTVVYFEIQPWEKVSSMKQSIYLPQMWLMNVLHLENFLISENDEAFLRQPWLLRRYPRHVLTTGEHIIFNYRLARRLIQNAFGIFE